MSTLSEDVSQSQGGTARAANGRIRRPSAKVQAMQGDCEREKTTHEQDEFVKAKKREERIRKRDQAMKAAQLHDSLMSSGAQATSPTVPTVADKAFGSRAAGGLGRTLTRASLATPLARTLVVRKGKIPPPPAFPKAQQTLPLRVRVFEPVEPQLEALSLNPPEADATARKRVHQPTPFPDEYTNIDVNPTNTQRKRIRQMVLSDDDEPMVGETVTRDAKAVGGDKVSLMAGLKAPVAKEQLAPSMKPTSPSHDTAGNKQTVTSTKSRPKAADYDAGTRRIIETGIEFYHALLLTENPFPDVNDELDMAGRAWDSSCDYYKAQSVEMDHNICRIITARGSHLRGQFKSKARATVATLYGFEMGDDSVTKEKNRKLTTELKINTAFAYRELHPRRAGIYKNKAIQQVINDVLFKNKNAEGIKWSEIYESFPRVAFALALTAIECAIDEWTTGKRELIYFKEDDYKPLYWNHLKALDYFDQRTKELGILPKMLEQAFENGRLHAGVEIGKEESGTTAIIADDVIQDAIKEFGQEGGLGEAKMDEIEVDEQGVEGYGDADFEDILSDGYAEDIEEVSDEGNME